MSENQKPIAPIAVNVKSEIVHLTTHTTSGSLVLAFEKKLTTLSDETETVKFDYLHPVVSVSEGVATIITVADIASAVDSGDRKRAVELWQEKQIAADQDSTRAALYRKARKDRSEFYKWLRNKLPTGSSADTAIRRVLTL